MRIHHACGCLGSLDEFLGVVFEAISLGVEDDSVRELLFEIGASDSSGGAPTGKLFDSSLVGSLEGSLLESAGGGGGTLVFCAGTATTSEITDDVDVVE